MVSPRPGLAITSPFSSHSDYDPAAGKRYSAIHSRPDHDRYPALDRLMPDSVAKRRSGRHVEYSDTFLSHAIPNLAPDRHGRVRLTGSGWGPRLERRGAASPPRPGDDRIAYKSSSEHVLDGSVEVVGLTEPLAGQNLLANTKARFSTPWQLILGARARVSKSLTLTSKTCVTWTPVERHRG